MESDHWTHFSPDARRNLKPLFHQVRKRLADYSEVAPVFHFVPGRIEVAGKHTDYAGGHSLVCATENGFVAGMVPTSDNQISIGISGAGEVLKWNLHGTSSGNMKGWGVYASTVIDRVIQNFGGFKQGTAIWLDSNLPQSAGLSSSSALITALFLSLDACFGLSSSKPYMDNIKNQLDLAQYLGAVENGNDFRDLKGEKGVGTKGGCQDHIAILCSQPGCISQFEYHPVRVAEHIQLHENWVFVIADSGIKASKTGNVQDEYNRATALAQKAVQVWNDAWDSNLTLLEEVIHSPEFSMDRFQDIIREKRLTNEEEIIFRVLHYCKERLQFVPEMRRGIVSANLFDLFMLSAQAQDAASRLLKNQTRETDFLASTALDHGAIAATAFGAGFGGSVWALCLKEKADLFLSNWQSAYQNKFPDAASGAGYFLTAPGPAAMRF